jgi:hypothetical protein
MNRDLIDPGLSRKQHGGSPHTSTASVSDAQIVALREEPRRVAAYPGRAEQLLRSIPLAGQLAPIVLAFFCSYLLYGRIADNRETVELACQIGAWTPGLASFVVLFLLLRLVDDWDDVDRDFAGIPDSEAQRSALRKRLRVAVIGCIAILAVLNHSHIDALVGVLSASALMLAAPFLFKRYLPRQRALAFPVFEGAPLLIFAYVYWYWRDVTGTALPWIAVASVITTFWVGYEFWKFSRKVHTDAMQPYLLSAHGIRIALNALLLAATVSNIALVWTAALLSVGYITYAVAVPVLLGAWLNASWSRASQSRPAQRRPLWAGLMMIWALELGIASQLLSLLVRK